MPDDKPNENVPDKIKKVFGWLKSVEGKDVVDELKEVFQSDPGTYAFNKAKDLLQGEGIAGELVAQVSPDITSNLSEDLAKHIRSVFSNPAVIEFSETMGSLVTEPVLSIFESYAAKEDFDPSEFARSFHGAMILLGMPKTIGSMVDIEVAGTSLGDVGKALDSVYWSLGLGFLGWQTLAPLLSAGLQPRLERHYNKLYRPKRLALSDMIYLYLIGEVEYAEIKKFIGEEGYSDKLTQTVIENSFKTLNRGELEEFYSKGQITASDVYETLIKQGYKPKHAAFLRDNITLGTEDTNKSASLSRMREAVKKGIRTRDEYRKHLASLDYSKEAIELEIELINYDMLTDRRELSISQIKSAYMQGVLTKTDVYTGLKEFTYSIDDIGILIDTWNAEKAPKILKLNQGNILSALKAGVLSKSQALARLQQLNYNAQDATVLVETALTSVKSSSMRVSLAILLEARKINAISQAEFETRLKSEGIDTNDIAILSKLATFQPTQNMTSLDIEKAFKAGVIDTNKAKVLLGETRVSASAIDLKVKTWVEENKGFKISFTPATYLLWYRQGIIQKADLTKLLTESGYTVKDVELFIKSADLAVPDDLTRSEIGDLYLSDVIEKSRAIALLTKTGLSKDEINDLIKGWDKAIENETPEPSISAYIQALRNELLTEKEFRKKLEELGYEKATIDLYVKLSTTEEKEKTQKLTKADVLSMYTKTILNKSQTLERLNDMGFSSEDAELLLKLKEPKVEEPAEPKENEE